MVVRRGSAVKGILTLIIVALSVTNLTSSMYTSNWSRFVTASGRSADKVCSAHSIPRCGWPLSASSMSLPCTVSSTVLLARCNLPAAGGCPVEDADDVSRLADSAACSKEAELTRDGGRDTL